ECNDPPLRVTRQTVRAGNQAPPRRGPATRGEGVARMKSHVESISPVKSKLTIEVPPEEVLQEEEVLFRDLRRSAAVPGFRKGKAPVHVLKRLYGDRIRSDAVGRLIEKTYYDALRQEQIIPVNDADIELQEASPEKGISYTAVVEVRPKVQARGYTGLRLKKELAVVDESEVAARLDSLRSQRASFEPAPDGHVLGLGDMVVMDYAGTVEGEPFEGGKGEDRTVILGSGSLISGFEEGIVGAVAGEERTVDVTFPEDYRAENLAGKSARFQVIVKDAKIRHLPDVDDEFAKEVAGVDSLEALKARVREAVEAEKRTRAERAFRERVMDALLGANPFEVPESMVRNQQTFSIERLRRDLTQRGMDPEALGISRPDVQEVHRRAAERSVRWAFLLRAIAEAEALQVTDEDLEARIRAIAEEDGRPYSAVRSFFDEDDRLDTLRSHLLEGKVIDQVVASSSVEEVAGLGQEEANDE
ncbi:MAG: trigger factor, partial [Proteobacteria bacterium]|nr:trigger factor [Pseudomonadota bacterium]